METKKVNLDREDSLLLENLMLKEEIAKLSISKSRGDFQNYIAIKYKVDLAKTQVKINQDTKEIEFIPIE